MTTIIYHSTMVNHVVEHAHRENTASVDANTNLLTNSITPSKTPCKFIIYVSMATSGGTLILFRNSLATGERLNDDVALIANTPIPLEVEIAKNDNTINLQYTVASVIRQLIVKEVPL